MKDNKLGKIIIILFSYLIPIGLFILDSYALYGYMHKDLSLFTICGILGIIDQIVFSQTKGLTAIICLTIGGLFVFKSFWNSLCFALIIENIFCSVFGIIVYLFALICGVKANKDKQKEIKKKIKKTVYHCPDCNNIVKKNQAFCDKCGCEINWD